MSLLRDGYEIVNLNRVSLSYVREVQKRLARRCGNLYDYTGEHEELADIKTHKWAADQACALPKAIIEEHLPYFKALMGGDLYIQKMAYLRISRPGEDKDNIGFHRDTWYGDTPYELSVWIPLTETDSGNALRVLPGSHIRNESALATKRVRRPDVKKGSQKHSLGFIYDPPLRLVKPVKMKPLPVKVGQMIVFPLSLLHGQEVNRSKRTRFSVDCRLANSVAPIKLQRSRADDYYELLCETPVTAAAREYDRNNPK